MRIRLRSSLNSQATRRLPSQSRCFVAETSRRCSPRRTLRRLQLAESLADSVAKYIGIDVLPAVITANRRRWSSRSRRFLCRDLVRQRLPSADVVLCRDALVHLSHADALAALANLRRTHRRPTSDPHDLHRRTAQSRHRKRGVTSTQHGATPVLVTAPSGARRRALSPLRWCLRRQDHEAGTVIKARVVSRKIRALTRSTLTVRVRDARTPIRIARADQFDHPCSTFETDAARSS